MKLCAPCMRVLEGHGGKLCARCRPGLEGLLREPAGLWDRQWWVPEEGEGVLVPGMSRMGKSTALKEWAGFLMKENVPVYEWDPQREASVRGIKRESTPLGPLRTQVTVSELEDKPAVWLAYAPRRSWAPAIAIVPDEEYPERERRAEDFVRFTKVFLRNKPKNTRCVLMLEEVGLLEGDAEAETAIDEIFTTWGKEEVAPVAGMQCISMMPSRARRQARKVIAFAQRDDADIAAIRRLSTPRCARVVGELQRGECVLVDRMNLAPWKGDEDGMPEEAGAEDEAA